MARRRHCSWPLLLWAALLAVSPLHADHRELALCLAGQLRGVCLADDFASLFYVVLANFASVDVFLLFPDASCEADVATFHAAAAGRHGDLRIFPLCQTDAPPAEATAKQWLEGTAAGRDVHWHDSERLVTVLRMTKHLAACGKEVDAAQQETTYRFVARARADSLWHSFVSRLELESAVPPFILTNFVAMPIQGVVEDTFAIGDWKEMKFYFKFFHHFHQETSEQRIFRTKWPWCLVHATLRKAETCQVVFPENAMEEYLRLGGGIQMQKRKAICFDRVAPCMKPRSRYCTMASRHPSGFFDTDASSYDGFDRDYFLTAPAEYADFDTVLAARLAHLFHAEGARLGHPPRILDFGCGRGSYVEAFNFWSIPAVGIDGNSIIGRTLPHHSIQWDLTEPIDFGDLHGPGRLVHCQFVEVLGEDVPALSKVVQKSMGVDQPLGLGVMEFINGLDRVVVKSPDRSYEGESIDATEFIQHFCCADPRCAGYIVDGDQGAILKWVANPEERPEREHIHGMNFFGAVVLRDSLAAWIDGASGSDAFRGKQGLLDWSAKTHVKFSTADWALSLGLGAQVPRWGEAAVVANIARHAKEGAVVSWGQSGRNLRSPSEVVELFAPFGFVLDEALTQDLRMFAGLVHGGSRDDLVVLRNRFSIIAGGAAVEMAEIWGDKNTCQLSTVASGNNYGPLGPGRVWVSGSCKGRFRAAGASPDAPSTMCWAAGVHIRHGWSECVFSESADGQGFVGADTVSVELPSVAVDNVEASWLYDTADHMVPSAGVWRGDPRLNLVFFKLARALVAPQRAHKLQSAWSWIWTSSWRKLLGHLHVLALPPPPSLPGYVDRSAEAAAPAAWYLARVFDMLQVEGISTFPAAQRSDCRPELWELVEQELDAALMRARGCATEALGATKACADGDQLYIWERVEAAQRRIADMIASAPAERVLRGEGRLSEVVLPKLLELARDFVFGAFDSRAQTGGAATALSYGEFLGLENVREGCEEADGRGRANLRVRWARKSTLGWYLYRLAAIDPDM